MNVKNELLRKIDLSCAALCAIGILIFFVSVLVDNTDLLLWGSFFLLPGVLGGYAVTEIRWHRMNRGQ